ncbi:MAG TPA: right-handed parallel beta-helix repeat-containing protein, partial [Clostridiaceae bacterium]|nr:right-handed parallel beta-helix repeat-containing protein [Clostridiaceae bacterium]
MKQVCELTVGIHSGDFVGDTNVAIQAAVDKAASLGGGIVRIQPGRYTMLDSLHLRSNVAIIGTEGETILWKPPSVSSPIIYYLGYGHFDISVKEPEKFLIGSGIYIYDKKTPGFYSTVATVVWKKGNEIGLSRMLNADVHPANDGRAVTVYPIVSGCYIKNAILRNIIIDGNSAENEYINGCRGGGVYLYQAHDIRLENITVKNFNGDGISFQQCINTIVEGCVCIDNTGHGLHPGSGSVGTVIRNCTFSANGQDGIFYCLRVSYTLCENCVIKDNKRHGISIGHRDNNSILRKNRIVNNGGAGIYFRPDEMNFTGHDTLIEENYLENNCRLENAGEICFDTSTKNVHIINNIIKPWTNIIKQSTDTIKQSTNTIEQSTRRKISAINI